MRSFPTSDVRLFCPDSLAVKEKSPIVTVQEVCEVPVTLPHAQSAPPVAWLGGGQAIQDVSNMPGRVAAAGPSW